MGQVYLARHKQLGREVALKVLPPSLAENERAVGRFMREMKAIGKLDHPNIVRAHDAGQEEGRLYFVMEFVRGQNLADYIQRRGQLSVEQAVACVLRAARGLAYAHEKGVIHRDVKPSNLLVDKHGTVKVADLGLARYSSVVDGDSTLTHSEDLVGTIDYLAPEQAANAHLVDGRADVYGLGCTLYTLLVGEPPYRGGTMEKLLAHREAEIPSLRVFRKDVPRELDTIYQRMLAKEPSDRQQSMATVIDELEAFSQHCSAEMRVSSFLQGLSEEEEVVERPASYQLVGPARAHKHPPVAARNAWRVFLLAACAGCVILGVIAFIRPGIPKPGLRHTAVAFSPINEAMLAVGEDDGTVRFWDKQGGRPQFALRPELASPSPVEGLAFSPDGSRIAVAHRNQIVRLWSLDHRTEIDVVSAGTAPIMFSHDGSALLHGVVDGLASAVNIDAGTRHSIGQSVTDARVLAVGRSYVAALDQVDEKITVWDASTGNQHWKFESTAGRIETICLSTDGFWLAGGTNEGTIQLWDIESLSHKEPLVGHDGSVLSLAFFPTGSGLVSTGSDRSIKVWDFESGKLMRSIDEAGAPVTALAVSSDNQTLAGIYHDGTFDYWTLSDYAGSD